MSERSVAAAVVNGGKRAHRSCSVFGARPLWRRERGACVHVPPSSIREGNVTVAAAVRAAAAVGVGRAGSRSGQRWRVGLGLRLGLGRERERVWVRVGTGSG